MKRTFKTDTVVPAGTKVVFFANAGMVGTDHAEGFILGTDMTEDTLDNEAWRFGVDWAESYGVYPASEYADEDIDINDECYSDNIEGHWDFYDPEEHDGKITYGTSEPRFATI